jgi:hypothetical protein
LSRSNIQFYKGRNLIEHLNMCLNVDQDEETYRKCLEQEVVHEGENGYVDWRWLAREGHAKEKD